MAMDSLAVADETFGQPQLWLPALELGQQAALPTASGTRYAVRAAFGVTGISATASCPSPRTPTPTCNKTAERFDATTALPNGVDVKTVSAMLGHYDAGFTLRTYTHATRQMQNSAAEKMGHFMVQIM